MVAPVPTLTTGTAASTLRVPALPRFAAAARPPDAAVAVVVELEETPRASMPVPVPRCAGRSARWQGHFSVAAPSLLGRVGDFPIIGAGFMPRKNGAVAVTCIGEQIMPHLLARCVYGWIEDGLMIKLVLEPAL